LVIKILWEGQGARVEEKRRSYVFEQLMQAQVAGKAEMSVAEVLLLAVFAILRQADTGVKQSFAQKPLMKFIPPKSQIIASV
jgi:hypothetical protein